jgi:hypothetical protein
MIKNWRNGEMAESDQGRQYFLCQAAEHGYLEVLKYSQTLSPPMELSQVVIYYASKGGDMDVIHWLHDKGCPGHDKLHSYCRDARHAECGDDRGLYGVAAFLFEMGFSETPPPHYEEILEHILREIKLQEEARAVHWSADVSDATSMVSEHHLECECHKCELRGRYNQRFGPYSDRKVAE